MGDRRTRLRWIVTLWLLCRGSSLAAAPFTACCRDAMKATASSRVAESAGADATWVLHAHAPAGGSSVAATTSAASETVPCVT